MITLSSFKSRPLGSHKGFTLVELIVTIVLVGIIGTFTTLFVYTGLNGYLTVRDTSEGALKAQIALDRLSLELRDIDSIDWDNYADNARIDYTSRTLPGNRQILYNVVDGEGVISVNGGNGPQDLLRGVSSFNMTRNLLDLNANGDNNVESIEVSFNTEQVGRMFRARIFPRNMVAGP
jgi:prepilin-type N-terminal cleavage/methylation domain-containing protein